MDQQSNNEFIPHNYSDQYFKNKGVTPESPLTPTLPTEINPETHTPEQIRQDKGEAVIAAHEALNPQLYPDEFEFSANSVDDLLTEKPGILHACICFEGWQASKMVAQNYIESGEPAATLWQGINGISRRVNDPEFSLELLAFANRLAKIPNTHLLRGQLEGVSRQLRQYLNHRTHIFIGNKNTPLNPGELIQPSPHFDILPILASVKLPQYPETSIDWLHPVRLMTELMLAIPESQLWLKRMGNFSILGLNPQLINEAKYQGKLRPLITSEGILLLTEHNQNLNELQLLTTSAPLTTNLGRLENIPQSNITQFVPKEILMAVGEGIPDFISSIIDFYLDRESSN